MATEATPLLVDGGGDGRARPTWRQMASFVARYASPTRVGARTQLQAAGALGTRLLARTVAIAPELLTKQAVDEVFGGSLPWRPLLAALVLSLTASALSSAARVAQSVTMNELGQRVSVDVFAHLHELELAFHLEKNNGEVLKYMKRGTSAVTRVVGAIMFDYLPVLWDVVLVSAVFRSVGVPAAALVVMAAVAVFLMYTAFATKHRTALQREINGLHTKSWACQLEILGNLEMIETWGTGPRECARLVELESAAAKGTRRADFVRRALGAGERFIRSSGTFLALLVAARAVGTGDEGLSPGGFLLVKNMCSKLFSPFIMLSHQYKMLAKALTDLEDLVVVWRRKPAIRDASHAVKLQKGSGGEVRFENVRFCYRGDSEGSTTGGGVTDINFTVPIGKTMALVGATGSGKSTIARLLLRLVEAQAGRVLVDGVDVRDIRQDSLREYIGMVPQQTVLFNDTLLYNLRYAKSDATREKVMEAAGVAALSEFISELPKDLEQRVGERGVKLSGGQLSRCGIARCVVQEPTVVILDESTAALDIVNERAVQRGLERVCRDRTTIIIAHRLATVAHADEILVLDKGRIVETGTHAELVDLGGIYAEMWMRQIAAGSESTENRSVEATKGG